MTVAKTNKSNRYRRLRHAVPILLICLTVNLIALWAMSLWATRGGSGREKQSIIAKLLVTIENKALDIRFLARGTEKPSGKIGILAVDEKSIQKFGRWPFSRKVFATALINLKKSGAEWIGFDVVWDQPERALLEDALPIIERMKNNPKDAKVAWLDVNSMRVASFSDLTLAQALKDYAKVVLGYYTYAPFEEDLLSSLGKRKFEGLNYLDDSVISLYQTPQGMDLNSYDELKLGALVGNTSVIAASTSNGGFFNNDIEDDDAVYRNYQLVKQAEGKLLPAIALKMAASMLNRQIFVNFDRLGVESIQLPDEQDDKKNIEIPVDPLGSGKMLINHLGRSKNLRHISLADAYDNSFSKEERQAIKGMSFMLGPTAMAINDLRANPFDSTFNGVEHHATVIDNIVSKRFLRRPQEALLIEAKVLIILAFIFSLFLAFSSAFISALCLVVTYVGYFYLDRYFWFGKGIWIFLGLPYLQVSVMFLAATVYKYFVEEREKKKVKGAFQHYLSAEVMEQVLNDPSRLKLGGDRRECTMFFSDVRDFTSISESLPPERLVELMNDYLSPMTEIILKSSGVLDKYIGDAIMAFWGAPLDNPTQVDTAMTAVLRMIEKVSELKKTFPAKNFPPIDIGCGLNTGVVSVGNMGSNERFAYTVMGDAVNLCARLESITKEYGVRCLVSQNTVAKIKEPRQFLLRDIDDIVVKGKREPVKIFELMHPSYFLVPNVIAEFIGEFSAMRQAYREQSWQLAKKHLQACLTIRPDDGPSNLYFKRIKEMEEFPKIENWDGVHRFKHK